MTGVIRTQISLTEAQHAGLREIAAARGVSMSEIIRQAVDEALRTLGREARIDRAIENLGGFRSGHTDTAESHDSVLDRAYST
jgi:Arc/MetJ-type ribon-helix-helix transcriptional regulator